MMEEKKKNKSPTDKVTIKQLHSIDLPSFYIVIADPGKKKAKKTLPLQTKSTGLTLTCGVEGNGNNKVVVSIPLEKKKERKHSSHSNSIRFLAQVYFFFFLL
jgi:hypothetical protein